MIAAMARATLINARIATMREGTHALHCIAWRDHGHWRRLSDWSEQMPESAV